MKVFFFFLILFLSFQLSGCYALEPRQGKSDLAQAQKANTDDALTWDFGQVKEGEVLRHDFIFKNQTAKTLRIKGVNTSCGCTLSEARKKELLPAESTLLEVSFDSKEYSGATKQFVYVHTDNLDNPVIRFIIKADVIRE